MNRIFITLSLFLVLLTNCTSPKPKESTLKVPVNVTKQLNSEEPKESTLKVQVKVNNKLNSEEYKKMEGVFYSIDIDLVNNTDSIINFWIMTCSWQKNFVFNTESIFLINKGCDGNYPHQIQIEPGQKTTFNGIIRIVNTSIIKNHNDVRLGFFLIKEAKIFENFNFNRIMHHKITREKDIIWSNVFKFKA